MALALPNYDDRRWSDLVDEGRALIPFYAPEWTDHNVHDPGITVVELLAWVAEQDIYRLNRISDAHRRKFLSLVGVHTEAPKAAFTVLTVTPKAGQTAGIPAGVEFDAPAALAGRTRFQTLAALTAADVHLTAVQLHDAAGFHDLTRKLVRQEAFPLLGEDPQPGAELYLGFAETLPPGVPVSLYFQFDELERGRAARRRYQDERTAATAACAPAESPCKIGSNTQPPVPVPHPCQQVRIVWEYLGAPGTWEVLTEGATDDETEGFTWNGRVTFTMRGAMTASAVGLVDPNYFYLRARFASGAFDAARVLQRLLVNAVDAEQSAASGTLSWDVAAGAAIEGAAPAVGNPAAFRLAFDAVGAVSRVTFLAPGVEPSFRLLAFYWSATAPGKLMIEAERLGRGTGRPDQQVTLDARPVVESAFRLFTLEGGAFRQWRRRADFDSSSRGDSDYLLDETKGLVTFGNGENGRAAPADAAILAAYRTTLAQAGNVPATQVTALPDTLHNRAIPGFDLDAARAAIETISNPLPAVGGAAEETLPEAEGRASAAVADTARAVTLGDYETLALATPGVHIARVAARANLNPAFPCMHAPGIVTVIILPFLPKGRPSPSRCVLDAVAAYLGRRRIIGTRVMVVPPSYTQVTVRTTVTPLPNSSPSEVRRRVVNALSTFLDPLTGGREGTGWPFGRSVYRAEVLQVIDQVTGVDHVVSLELIADGSPPQCGNLCIGAIGLVDSGQHEVTVEGAICGTR